MLRDSTDAVLFKHLVDRDDEFVDLASASLLISEIEYLEPNTQECLRNLDGWARQIRKHAGPSVGQKRVFVSLCHVLFESLNIRGDDDDYYDLRNAFLSDVMERRLGIPLSLTVLVMVMAERVELQLDVIGKGGNYFVRFSEGDEHIIIDPDDRGARVDDDEVSEILGTHKNEWQNDLICDRQLIRRLLTHLALLYGRRGQCRKHLKVVERLLILDRGTNHMLIGLRDHLRQKIETGDHRKLS